MLRSGLAVVEFAGVCTREQLIVKDTLLGNQYFLFFPNAIALHEKVWLVTLLNGMPTCIFLAVKDTNQGLLNLNNHHN